MKSSEQTQALFANGTIGMLLGGDWQIPFLQKNMTKYKWDVTYMPRDVAMASDLGGNCLAVSRDNMRAFVTAGQYLPVRRALMNADLEYALRPAAMKVYIEQARTIPDHLVRTVTMPIFSKINAAMADELDLTFTSGQDPTTTARNLDTKIKTILNA